MKINGKKIEGMNEVPVVIPRKGKEDLVFIAVAVLDYSDHDKINKTPIPSMKKTPDGSETPILSSPEYQEATQEWGLRKSHWMIPASGPSGSTMPNSSPPMDGATTASGRGYS